MPLTAPSSPTCPAAEPDSALSRREYVQICYCICELLIHVLTVSRQRPPSGPRETSAAQTEMRNVFQLWPLMGAPPSYTASLLLPIEREPHPYPLCPQRLLQARELLLLVLGSLPQTRETFTVSWLSSLPYL